MLNPYNNSLVMPLHDFIEHPIAAELLHNGGTLQVLGLTNYSYWSRQAQALRRCVTANSVAREMLLTLATKRLKHMAHVGITERLEESVLSLAADMGAGGGAELVQLTVARLKFNPDLGQLDVAGLLYHWAEAAQSECLQSSLCLPAPTLPTCGPLPVQPST